MKFFFCFLTTAKKQYLLLSLSFHGFGFVQFQRAMIFMNNKRKLICSVCHCYSRLMYINALRTRSLLFSSYAFRPIGRHLALNTNTSATGQTIGQQIRVKRRSGRFLRNYFIANGVLLGAGSLYYFYYLTPKERRQIRVTFEGIRRGIRFVFPWKISSLQYNLEIFHLDPFISVSSLLRITNIFFGQLLKHHQNMNLN